MLEMLMAIFFIYSTSGITFELERRSKAQNVGNAHGYLFYIFNFRYNFRWKVCRKLKMAAILKIMIYLTQLQSDLRYEKIVQNYVK